MAYEILSYSSMEFQSIERGSMKGSSVKVIQVSRVDIGRSKEIYSSRMDRWYNLVFNTSFECLKPISIRRNFSGINDL